MAASPSRAAATPSGGEVDPGPSRAVALAGGAWVVAAAVMLLLLALASAYGFHRDELYFIVAGRHPAFGYVDQPPFTPLVSAAAVALLGLSPLAVRILPAIVMGAITLLAADMTRGFGGSRRAQVLAAVTVALSGLLAAGHLDSTATFDLLAWALTLWLLVGLLRRPDRSRWLAVGLVAGLGLENKDTILILAAGLAAGLLIARRWDVLRSRWAWLAGLVALLLWLPNLVWQASNDFPQLAMARALAGGAADNRANLLPELLLLAGPLLFPVSMAGLAWLLRSPGSQPWRALGWAFLAVLAIVVVSGGKSYYAVGFYPALMAAGAIVLDGWLGRGRRRLRATAFGAAAALSGLVAGVLVLPLVPVSSLGSSPIPGIYKESAEQVGWPELVATVARVAGELPAGDRARAVILTANYGEAGALELLGAGDSLPPVYSGHNAYWGWGPPPADRTVTILVGLEPPPPMFEGCRLAATIDNGLGVANQEQGAPVEVCSGMSEPWAVAWPGLRHYD